MKGFNSKTYIAKEIKLSAIAKELKLNKEEKDSLKCVQTLCLEQVFDAERLGLKQSKDIQSIYVYRLALTEDTMPMLFIKALDKGTKAHTIFELKHNNAYTYIMANKQIKDSVGVGEYYEKQTEEYEHIHNNNTTALAGLYYKLLAFVLDISERENETPTELASRKQSIVKCNKEIAGLEKQKKTELQFNKKVVINERIRALRKEVSLHE